MHDIARENGLESLVWDPTVVETQCGWRAESESVDVASRDWVYRVRRVEKFKSTSDVSEGNVRDVSIWFWWAVFGGDDFERRGRGRGGRRGGRADDDDDDGKKKKKK